MTAKLNGQTHRLRDTDRRTYGYKKICRGYIAPKKCDSSKEQTNVSKETWKNNINA